MKLLAKLEKNYEVLFLIIISSIFSLLRLPSLFEPYWYGDEGIYEVIGYALRHGRLLYQGIWDNKPPALYLVYALFDGSQSYIRFISLISGIGAVILFFLLTKKLFSRNTARISSTIIFAILFGLPFIEGNIANAENFILPITLAAALLILHTNQLHGKSTLKEQTTPFLSLILFSAGLLLGIAFLFKIVAIFDLAAFTLFLFITQYKNTRYILREIVKFLPLYIGFIIPFILTVIYFTSRHALRDFITSAFLMNVGYVNAGNQFIIPQGLLVGKLIILLGICIFLFLKRKAFATTTLFLNIWLAFSVFNVLFSQRPYAHYLLVFIASFSLFLGMAFFERKMKVITVLIYLFIFIFLFKDFWYFGRVFGYYNNFINFVTNRETITTYRSFFDKATLWDYELAEYINTYATTRDSLFIWGDNGQLYRLTNKLPPGRFIVAYHMVISPQTIAETRAILQRTKPKFVIIMPQKPPLPYSLDRYKADIEIHGAIIYERIY